MGGMWELSLVQGADSTLYMTDPPLLSILPLGEDRIHTEERRGERTRAMLCSQADPYHFVPRTQ